MDYSVDKIIDEYTKLYKGKASKRRSTELDNYIKLIEENSNFSLSYKMISLYINLLDYGLSLTCKVEVDLNLVISREAEMKSVVYSCGFDQNSFFINLITKIVADDMYVKENGFDEKLLNKLNEVNAVIKGCINYLRSIDTVIRELSVEDVPEEAKKAMRGLTPDNYIGNAKEKAKNI